MKVYGDVQSGNCYKVKLLCALLNIKHEGGFDLDHYPAIQFWLNRIATEPNYVGME